MRGGRFADCEIGTARAVSHWLDQYRRRHAHHDGRAPCSRHDPDLCGLPGRSGVGDRGGRVPGHTHPLSPMRRASPLGSSPSASRRITGSALPRELRSLRPQSRRYCWLKSVSRDGGVSERSGPFIVAQSCLSAPIGSIRPARSAGISAAHIQAATMQSRLAA